MFSDEIKYQLDFVKKSRIFYLQVNLYLYQNTNRDIKRIETFLKTQNSKKISLVNYHECFPSQDYLDKVKYIIENNSDKEIYISAATSSNFQNSFHPIVNILFWKPSKIRENISFYSDKSVTLFDEKLYKFNVNKSNKGILSVRRETELRNYLFSIINKKSFDGIIRYIRYRGWGNISFTKNNLNNNLVNEFPNFINLLNEYKKSFISFVVETETNNNIMNLLTEKTLIAFLTKTMPIVLGGKNYVKELKDMGFYVWNDEFGFEDGDVIPTMDYKKVDLFNKCITTYNKMTKEDIEKIYNSNLDKIENNYNIVSNILFGKSTLI